MEVRERRRSGKRRAGGESRVEKASRRDDGLKRKERNMRTRISPARLTAGTPQTLQRHPRPRGLKRLRVIRNVYVEKEQILRRNARGRPPSILLSITIALHAPLSSVFSPLSWGNVGR